MPKLIVKKGPMEGKVSFFGGHVVCAGRGSENDIQLEGREISRKHFKFVVKNDSLYIEDLKSRNGTLLNGKAVVPGKEFEVKENDVLSIGNSEFQLSGLPGVKDSPEKVPSIQPPETGSDGEEKPFKERRSMERKNLELISEITELLRLSISINEVL